MDLQHSPSGALQSSSSQTESQAGKNNGDVRNERPWIQRTLSRMSPGSQRASTFGLVSTSLGSALLSTPFVFAKLGLALGSAILIFTGVATGLSLQVLAHAADATSGGTYGGMVKKSIGGSAAMVADVIFMIYGFFTALGCYIFLKQLIPQFGKNIGLPESLFSSDLALLGVLTLFPIAPLCLVKTLSALRYISLLSVISSVITIIVLCVVMPIKHAEFIDHISHAPAGSAESLPSNFWWFPSSKQPWVPEVPLALAICLFALTNHVNLFTTRSELSQPEPRRLSKVIARASIFQTFIYWLFGVACFLALGPPCDDTVPSQAWPSCTPVNALASPRFLDAAGTVAQGCMVIIVIASIVLNLGAGRRAGFQLLGRWQSRGSEPGESQGVHRSLETPLRSGSASSACSESTTCHVVSTLSSVFVIMLAGAYLNSIEDVLSILGGFCVASYGFVIPLLAMLCLRSTNSADLPPGSPMPAHAMRTQPRCKCLLTTVVLALCGLIGYANVGQTIWKLLIG